MEGKSFEDFLKEELKNPEFAFEYIKSAIEEPFDSDAEKYEYLINVIRNVAEVHRIVKGKNEK